MGLHTFIRCRTTSCFKIIGKVKPIKVLDKKDHFELLLSQIGRTVSVSADLEVELEELIYKHHKETNELRLSILQENCGGDKIEITSAFSLESLPPSRDVLKQHIRRGNYQV